MPPCPCRAKSPNSSPACCCAESLSADESCRPMCGRYALFRWSPALATLPGFPSDQQPHWNLAPGSRVLMLREAAGERQAALARWGLTPAWLTDLSKTPAQARAETLAEQPMFREAFRQRRCLLPANGFYEWRGARKRPYWISGE